MCRQCLEFEAAMLVAQQKLDMNAVTIAALQKMVANLRERVELLPADEQPITPPRTPSPPSIDPAFVAKLRGELVSAYSLISELEMHQPGSTPALFQGLLRQQDLCLFCGCQTSDAIRWQDQAKETFRRDLRQNVNDSDSAYVRLVNITGNAMPHTLRNEDAAASTTSIGGGWSGPEATAAGMQRPRTSPAGMQRPRTSPAPGSSYQLAPAGKQKLERGSPSKQLPQGRHCGKSGGYGIARAGHVLDAGGNSMPSIRVQSGLAIPSASSIALKDSWPGSARPKTASAALNLSSGSLDLLQQAENLRAGISSPFLRTSGKRQGTVKHWPPIK